MTISWQQEDLLVLCLVETFNDDQDGMSLIVLNNVYVLEQVLSYHDDLLHFLRICLRYVGVLQFIYICLFLTIGCLKTINTALH